MTEHAACGVPYLRDAAGGYRTYATLGMSYPRVGEVKHDGVGLTLALRKELLHRGALLVEDVAITGLVLNRDGVQGAWGASNRGDTGHVFIAPVVILACGAATGLYSLRSASFPTTGDGYRLALEAGAKLRNMEFVEFTVIPCFRGVPLASGGIKPTLAAGATLLNGKGERFLSRYDPALLGNTTRSVLVKAVFGEMQQGRGPCAVDASAVERPTSLLKCLAEGQGLDYRRERIPLSPGVHTFLGGVWTDPYGRTGVPGLFASGETAGLNGVFGADRVGGALAVCQVLGAVCGREAAAETRLRPRAEAKEVRRNARCAKAGFPHGNAAGPLDDSEVLRKVHQLAETVGVARTGIEIEQGAAGFNGLCREIADMISAASDANPKWGLKFFELQNLALTGAAIALSALARCESRGQHWRLDCPQSDPAYTGWVVVEQEGGRLKSNLVRGLPAKLEGGVSNAAAR